MRRSFVVPGIVFVVGFIFLLLRISKISSALTSAGIGLMFLGLVLFGLSFIKKPESGGDESPMSAAESLTKIFYAPTEVFRNLRRRPRWLAALLLMSIISGVYLVTFHQRLTPEAIAGFMTDKIVESGFVPEEQKPVIYQSQLNEMKDPVAEIGNGINSFVGNFTKSILLAAIYLIIILAMGNQINFWQSFAATVYAAFPVVIIRKLLSLVILFLKEPSDVHPLLGQETLVQDNLGILFNPAQNPVLFALGAAIGLLSFYHLWLTATGLKNAGEKVSGGAAWAATLIVWVFGAAIGVLSAAFFPSFLS